MKNWRELKPHKLNVYPPMQDWEFQELKESINKGYDDRYPIVVHVMGDEVLGIIDGANRHRACLETNMIPLISRFYGDEKKAMEYILKTNNRRNLNAGQKAAVVLEMKDIVKKIRKEAAESRTSNLPNGKNKKKVPRVRTAESISKIANVSERTVAQTIKIQKVDPQLFEAVKEGKISAKSAYNQIQDKIKKNDKDLENQRFAKLIVKGATSQALEVAKHELLAKALERIEYVEANNIKSFPFKFVLTLEDWDGKCTREASRKKLEAETPVSAASLIDFHRASKESPAIKK